MDGEDHFEGWEGVTHGIFPLAPKSIDVLPNRTVGHDKGRHNGWG